MLAGQIQKTTLFPYTTLFRSRQAQRSAMVRADPRQHDLRRRVQLAHRAEQDRKSTRLNSSHVSTSYAVFCLKKKKQAGDILPVGTNVVRDKSSTLTTKSPPPA